MNRMRIQAWRGCWFRGALLGSAMAVLSPTLPVWADQTVFQRGVSPSAGYTNMSEPSGRIYTYTTSSTPGNPTVIYLNTPAGAREIAYFDLSSLPAGATITQAVFKYYCYYPSTPISGQVFIYRVRTNWLGGAAWSNVGGDWTDASGVDQGTSPYAIYQATGATGWFTWDVTTLVQGWYSGSFPNYGLFIIASTSASGNAQFRGSGYSTLTFRPILEVTYTLGSGDTTPPTGTVSVNSGATNTNTTAVMLTLSASDVSGVSEMQFSNDGTTYSTPEAYATSKSWTLSTGDGTKTVYAKFKDTAGNWMTTPATDTITLDTTAPTGGSVSINSGAAATNTTAVTLTLSATDAGTGLSQMQFSNDGTTYSAAEAYATSKSWTLTAGDGTKTVYAKFKDVAGNWSAAATDTITLDTAAPTVSAVNASSITQTAATMTWTTNEAATSQVEYGTTTSYGQLTTLDQTLITSHSVGLSGLTAGTLYHFRVRSKDAAGNERIGTDATFTTQSGGDTTPPTGSVTINGGAAATNNAAVTLTLSATDASGVAQMQFSNDGTTYSTPEAYATSKSWTLATGDGTKTVYVKFKDTAGNWMTTPATDTITLDTTPPTMGFISPQDGETLSAPAP